MKIAKLEEFYPHFLSAVYSRQPDLVTKKYQEQWNSLMHQSFGWSDSWKNALAPLGYDVLEIVPNATNMQAAWMRENLSSSAFDWRKIALEQVKKFKPEILWYNLNDTKLLEVILAEVPSIRFSMGAVGSAIGPIDCYRPLNLMLSCAPETVERLRAAGLKAEHLNHPFDRRFIERVSFGSKKYECSFIGQTIPDLNFHLKRTQYLTRLVKETPLNVFSERISTSFFANFKWLIKAVLYSFSKMPLLGSAFRKVLSKFDITLKAFPPFPRNIEIKNLRPSVYGLDMYQAVADSKLVLNIHADSSPDFASNMRLFETTGMGTCLITDWKKNISDLFEPGKEVVTYNSIEECIEKIKWYLDHPEERERIAAAGQARCHKDHSFEKRAQQLEQILRSHI